MLRYRGPKDKQGDLAQLKHQLRENERIWSGFRGLEIRMIGARSLRELVAVLSCDLPRTFEKVACATLSCADPEYELSRLLEQEAVPILPVQSLVTLAPGQLESLFMPPYKPRLGPSEPTLQAMLFPGYPSRLASLALAPLTLHGRLIGCVSQGSHDPAHFTGDTATDLLEHLAAVTAMCLESALIRERLKLDGLTDPLTAIANRRFFERRLTEEIERWSRRHEPLACILVDIDHFKKVNDQYGHQAGDRVLKEVAKQLGDGLRASDVLARYGGEEFVLLLPITTAVQAEAIAERLRANIEHYSFPDLHGGILDITASFGISSLEMGKLKDATPATNLFRRADLALYQAKESGRNKVVILRMSA
jgi:diguanylate cyclase (GGDEF)-like protein